MLSVRSERRPLIDGERQSEESGRVLGVTAVAARALTRRECSHREMSAAATMTIRVGPSAPVPNARAHQ